MAKPISDDAALRERERRASRIIAGAASVARGLVGLDTTYGLFVAAAQDLADAMDDRATRARSADGWRPLRD